jgi:hypothetical protein
MGNIGQRINGKYSTQAGAARNDCFNTKTGLKKKLR